MGQGTAWFFSRVAAAFNCASTRTQLLQHPVTFGIAHLAPARDLLERAITPDTHVLSRVESAHVYAR